MLSPALTRRKPALTLLLVSKVLLFFPHNPLPSRTGAHSRFHSLARALQAMGKEVHLVSAPYTSDAPWTEEAIQALGETGISVHLAPAHRGLTLPMRKGGFKEHQRRACPPSLRRYFRSVLQQIQPDGVVVFYTLWKSLVPSDYRGRAWLDLNDVLSRNLQMKCQLKPYFPDGPLELERLVPRSINGHRFAGVPPVDPEEMKELQRFEILVLAEQEKHELDFLYPQLKFSHVPLSIPAGRACSHCEDLPVMIASANVFNRQGLGFFLDRVLPRILKSVPDFRFRLYGDLNLSAPLTEALVPVEGFREFDEIFEGAAFSLCPAYEGTGEQTKILESLSRGTPVVAMRARAEATPLRHGRNGYMAEDGITFADYCQRLWADRNLCRSLGRAGQESCVFRSEEELVFRLEHLWEHAVPDSLPATP